MFKFTFLLIALLVVSTLAFNARGTMGSLIRVTRSPNTLLTYIPIPHLTPQLPPRLPA